MKIFSSKARNSIFARFSEDKEEYRKVLVLFLYLMFVSAASTIGRTAADALFLSHFDSSYLAKMYLPQSAALILAGLAFQKFALRFRIDRFLYGLVPSLALLVILSRIEVGLGRAWVLPVIYVAYDVFNFLMVVCFWQFASAILDQRKVKRMIGLVGSGGITGGILSGFGLKLIVPWAGTANLIVVYAALQLLALAAVITLVRRSGNPKDVFTAINKTSPASPSSKAKKRHETEKKGLFSAVPHLKYVTIMSAALILTLTLVDYQFKVILKGQLQNDALTGFMGSFYGVAGLLALAVQVFVAGKLLTRFGVMTAILIFPVVLLMGSLGVLILPVLAMSVLVKGSDKVVGDTINSSVNQLIMFPIAPEWRNKAKSFLDGIVRNGAKGLASVGLLLLAPLLTTRQFSFVIIGLLVVCIAAAIQVKGAYLKLLLASLQSGTAKLDDAELDVMDPASVQLLADALRSPDKQQVLYAMRVFRGMDGFDLSPYLPILLRHPSSEVVIETLQYMERSVPVGMESELDRLLDSSESHVKAYALTALAAYARDDKLELIMAFLGEKDMETKSGAIAGLIKYYGIEGMFQAVGPLKELLESKDDRERSAVATLFGKIGIKEFYKPLIPLLQDPSPEVRKRALRSAGVLQVPELIGCIVPMLQHGDTRKDAIESLASYDDKMLIPHLEIYLNQEPPPLHLPKVFERIANLPAFEKLIAAYPASGFEMRNRIVEALNRMRRSVDIPEKVVSSIEEIVLQEVDLIRGLTEKLTGFPNVEQYRDVADVGGQIRSETVWRIFQWLALVHDPATIRAVYANWRNGDARQQANAMEVVDQLTHGPMRMELAKLMGTTDAALFAHRTVQQLEDQLTWLSQQPDAWLREVIRFAIDPQESAERKEQMERIRMLRNYSLFQDLTSRELSDLAAKLEQVSAVQGEYVFTDNDSGNSLYLVRNGTVGIYRKGARVAEKKAGDSFGQSGVLIRRNRNADAVAEADSLFWKLDSAPFYEVMFDRSSIAIEMMKQLSRRIRSVLSQRKAEEAPGRDAAGDSPRVEMRTTGSEIAATSQGVEGNHADSLLRRVLILQKIDLFAHLAEADLIRLAQMVDEVEYEEGEAICRAGEYGDTLYGIIEGNVRVHRGDTTLAFLGIGDCFGEMAIIDSGPRSADCTATAPSVLLELHKEQVFSLCFQNMEVMRSMMQVMGDRLKGMAG